MIVMPEQYVQYHSSHASYITGYLAVVEFYKELKKAASFESLRRVIGSVWQSESLLCYGTLPTLPEGGIQLHDPCSIECAAKTTTVSVHRAAVAAKRHYYYSLGICPLRQFTRRAVLIRGDTFCNSKNVIP